MTVEKTAAASGASGIAALPRLGLGLGLRNCHFDYIETHWPKVDWFEAISENFMDSGGKPRQLIRQVADRYPVVLHGVSMSIGSTDPLNLDYLTSLRALADELQPAWVSDHLCWTGVLGLNSHDLLPLPLTEETLAHVTARVHKVQDLLNRPLILENPSTYVTFAQDTLDEPEFLRALSDATGCGLLLDVNNVFVSSFNADTDPVDYIERFPTDRVVQMHLAGHTHRGTHIIDTHDQPVRRDVWELYRLAWMRTGGAATLLEWDGNIPDFETCHAELLKAKSYMSGNFDPAMVTRGGHSGAEATPNPVDHLVPDVMAGVLAR